MPIEQVDPELIRSDAASGEATTIPDAIDLIIAKTNETIEAAGASYTTLPSAEVVDTRTMLDRSSSRWSRLGINSLPRLLASLAAYRNDLQRPINIVGFGSSVQAGATLASPYDDAPTGYLTSRIKAVLDPGALFNWQPYNCGVNGSAIADFATHWAILITQLQVTAITMNSGGTGYAVGDVLTCAGGTVSDGFTLTGRAATIEVLAVSGTGAITLARISRAGMYKAGLGPTATNNVTGGSGSGAQFALTTAEIVPNLVQFGYGMNDGAPALYNSGQTYSGFLTYLKQAANMVHQVGSDLAMITTPHPAVVRYPSLVFNFPDSIPQNYPTVIAAPVLTSQLEPPYPNRADRGSLVTFDLPNGLSAVTISHRHARVNQAMRQIATDYGAAVVDAEWHWIEAMQLKIASTGSQLAAESVLFDDSQYNHPNLLGHQLSYHRAIDELCFAVAQQSHQPNYEPRLNGYPAVNGPGTSPASAVLDVYPPYPDQTTKPMSVKARTGSADGAGVKANAEQWYVDPATGEFVSASIRLPTARSLSGNVYSAQETHYGDSGYTGYEKRLTSYNVGAGSTIDIPIADDLFTAQGGRIRVRCVQSGVALCQVTEGLFSSHNGTLTLALGNQIGAGTEFTLTVSGTNLRITNTFANANYFIHVSAW